VKTDTTEKGLETLIMLTEVIRYLDSAIEILKNQQQVAICGFDMNLPPDKKLPA
jgi:hypothetical protein